MHSAILPIALAMAAVGSAATSSQLCHTAVLRNGFTIQYARREIEGAATRLWLCVDAGAAYVEIPGEQVDRFEDRDEVPPAPAAPLMAATPAQLGRNTNPLAPDHFQELINSIALRHQIDPDFVTSVVKAESGFDPTAISSKGARGLMQLMPQTATELGVEDALDPVANLEGGTKYLKQLLDHYNGDAIKALAAYNAGPQRVEQYGGIPPYNETRAFVARIIEDYNRKKDEQQSGSNGALGNR